MDARKPGEIVAACGTCIYFVKDALKQEGGCRRFPPQIVSVSAKTLQGMAMVPGAMFPQVSSAPGWWCGEYRPDEKKLQAADETVTKSN